MERPEKKKSRKGISPIWILPTIALCIGGWLLYKGIVERPIPIIVHFHSAEGVTPGRTKVMYKGIPVGIVEEVFPDKGLDSVSIKIAIDRRAKSGLVKDMKFWIVRPEITPERVRGLQTVLSGSYIAVQPGISKVPAREFQGLEGPPPVPENAPGLHIKLRSDQLYSLKQGSPIYYKDMKAGSVQGYKLDDDGTVLIDVYIEPKYKNLVKPVSRFWNASGITLSGGLSGIKFHMKSLSTLIAGGITFYTPESLVNGEPVKNGHVFKLYRDFDEAEYSIGVALRLEIGEGIVEGVTKVIYHGLEVGKVKKVVLEEKDSRHMVTAYLALDPMTKPILKEGTRFWVIRPSLGSGGVRNLGALFSGIYITFVPGEGKPCYNFVAEGDNSKEILKKGVFYRLVSETLQSIEPGTPILFKQVQVGEVARYELNKDNTVDLVFIIYDKYTHLINDKCVFWNQSGMNLKVSPRGISIQTGSLQSIISAGIAFDYPVQYYGKKLKGVKQGHKFRLFESFSNAVKHMPKLKPNGIFIKFETKESVSLMPGSPIYYKKVKVGEVIEMQLDEKNDKVIITGFLKNKYLPLVNCATRFYCVDGLEIEGSLRNRLKVETGPLDSILMGAVSFLNREKGSKIKEWHVFKLYKDEDAALAEDYIPIRVHFHSLQPVEVNSEVRYNGVDIGYIHAVDIDDNMQGMWAELRVEKRAESLFTTGSKVWVVKPEVRLGGVKNLGTIITGPYITIRKGPGELSRTITGLDSPPTVLDPDSGLNLILEAPSRGSLIRGAPVYYRQVKVGEVTGYEFSPDSRNVWIHVNIYNLYRPLVRENTRFWNVSGIRVDAGLFSGVKIKSESFESMVAGGITFATPEHEDMGNMVTNGRHFKLYDKPDEAWLKWEPAISLKR